MSSGRSGGMKRLNTVRSGWWRANSVICGSTRGSHGTHHGLSSSANRRCISTARWMAAPRRRSVMSALALEQLDAGLHQPPCAPRAFARQHLELLAVQPGIVGEEGLYFVEHLRSDVRQVVQMPMTMGVRRDGEETVVALPLLLLFLPLPHLENTDQSGAHDAAGRHGMVEEQQDIERIAIGPQGR